jgi:hypothetical protein
MYKTPFGDFIVLTFKELVLAEVAATVLISAESSRMTVSAELIEAVSTLPQITIPFALKLPWMLIGLPKAPKTRTNTHIYRF